MDETTIEKVVPFFEQAQVQLYQIPVGKGMPLGIKCVSNAQLGIGGAYGSWGES